jgi:G3E family GTPase
MARTSRAPIPVTVVAGPLGAGKTTLINRLLGESAFADTAVLLNDFGRSPLRGGIVEAAEDSFIALGSGCVCCAVRGALTDGLEKLLRDLDNGRVPAISRVVIEADAAADPSAILAAIERHPYLALRYLADGIVAVLDPASAGAVLSRRADTVRQIALADVVLLSRPSPAVEALVRALNPAAIVAELAIVAPSALVGHEPFDPADGDIAAWLATPTERPAAGMEGEAARISAFAVERPRTMSFSSLDRFVEYLAVLQAPNIIRVRGLVSTGGAEATLVEGVGGFFRPPLVLDNAGAQSIRFVVVARDLDRETFTGYLDAFLGEARIDTADARTVEQNPLAVAGFSARSGR